MRREPGQTFVLTVTGLAGLYALVTGFWALLAPGSFADVIDFPPENHHLLHDIGAFLLGTGATLLLAVAWADGLAVALAGFFVGNTAHAVNHLTDLDLGGRGSDWGLLGSLSVLVAAALAVRLRQLGYVLGRVGIAAGDAWAPFVRQKTVAVTTFRRDGTPVSSPVSIAVDGEVAYFRTWHTAGKAKRLRRDPTVLIAPSTGVGRPTGPPVRGKAELLDGDEARYAARLLARKYPILHNLVPFGHRLKRVRTLHYRVTLTAVAAPHPRRRSHHA
jgi:PPOX class probable F420-dependent enzyme